MRRGDYPKLVSSQARRLDPARRLLNGWHWGSGEFRMLRRSLLASPLLLAPTHVRAEWVPRQPIHVIVGFAPGGTADIAARLAGEAIQRRVGATVVVDNKSG